MARQALTMHCAWCGRTMTWRRAWARNWDQVRYCSAACRRRHRAAAHDRLEHAPRQLLAARPRNAATGPSEVARAVDGRRRRGLMEPAWTAARRLAAAGGAEVTQPGRVVDPSTAGRPIRIGRPR